MDGLANVVVDFIGCLFFNSAFEGFHELKRRAARAIEFTKCRVTCELREKWSELGCFEPENNRFRNLRFTLFRFNSHFESFSARPDSFRLDEESSAPLRRWRSRRCRIVFDNETRIVNLRAQSLTWI